MEKMQDFAQRMRIALAVRDITQAEVCKRTGIPKSAMSQYSTGKLHPRQDRLFEIAAVLGVSVPWLMGFNVDMDPAGRKEIPALESEDGLDAEIVSLLASLSDAKKREGLNYLRFLSANEEK